MKTKIIRQTFTFPTSPEKLYGLLFDSKVLSTIHGAKTSMTRKPKGKFTVFGGYCRGFNIALEPGRKIEQAWHFQEEGWPEDHFSTCTFLIEPAIKGARLSFIHKGVPAHTYEAIKAGWKSYYWEPILQYLEN